MGPAAYLPQGLPHVLQVLGELRDCQCQRVRLFHRQNPVLGQDFLKEWLKKDQLSDGTGISRLADDALAEGTQLYT